jgi:putative FmdB family regulatory protein
MPIYEYHCEKCDKNFECLVLGGDTPACPACGTQEVARLMSACGFVSKSGAGAAAKRAAADSGCSGCGSTNCSSCGH